MRKLYIIRGASGSGKTTLVGELEHAFYLAGLSCASVAADDYFDYSNKEWSREELGNAHKFSRDFVEDSMLSNISAIMVHNTFTTEKELKPYLEMAEKHEYEVTSVVMENRHGNVSVHNVPEATVLNQKQRLRSSIKL